LTRLDGGYVKLLRTLYPTTPWEMQLNQKSIPGNLQTTPWTMQLNQNQRVSNIPDVRFPPDAGGPEEEEVDGDTHLPATGRTNGRGNAGTIGCNSNDERGDLTLFPTKHPFDTNTQRDRHPELPECEIGPFPLNHLLAMNGTSWYITKRRSETSKIKCVTQYPISHTVT